MIKFTVGIDPGWKNLGLAILREDEDGLKILSTQTLNPSEMGGHGKAAWKIRGLVLDAVRQQHVDPEDVLIHVAIERYVSYNNVNSAETENILMLIGALLCALDGISVQVDMYRAIDWKTELVKLLVKNRGFDNPSTSLDKKFSVAAAHACLDIPGEFHNDHEADAVCLASIGLLKLRYPAKRVRKEGA